MSMNTDTELYAKIREDAVNGVRLHSTDKKRYYLVNGEIKELERKPKEIVSFVSTIDSFVSYVTKHMTKDTQVFVSVKQAWAVIDPSYGMHIVTLPFSRSSEFNALMSLAAPNNPKAMFQKLRTDLVPECLPPQMLMMVSQIRMADNGNKEIKIDNSGLTSFKKGRSLSIKTVINNQETSLSALVDWQFNGRIFCVYGVEGNFDLSDTYQIPLVLTVDADSGKGLTLTLTPKRLDMIIQKAVYDITQYIQDQLSSIQVYVA